MRHFLLCCLLSLLLAGCYSDQKQRLSACELRIKPTREPATLGDQDISAADDVGLCMRALGYEFVRDDCPFYMDAANMRFDWGNYDAMSPEEQRHIDSKFTVKAADMNRRQKLEPACYEPMSWLGKRSLRIEKWAGGVRPVTADNPSDHY
jgi:hypothetical protein